MGMGMIYQISYLELIHLTNTLELIQYIFVKLFEIMVQLLFIQLSK